MRKFCRKPSVFTVQARYRHADGQKISIANRLLYVTFAKRPSRTHCPVYASIHEATKFHVVDNMQLLLIRPFTLQHMKSKTVGISHLPLNVVYRESLTLNDQTGRVTPVQLQLRCGLLPCYRPNDTNTRVTTQLVRTATATATYQICCKLVTSLKQGKGIQIYCLINVTDSYLCQSTTRSA